MFPSVPLAIPSFRNATSPVPGSVKGQPANPPSNGPSDLADGARRVILHVFGAGRVEMRATAA